MNVTRHGGVFYRKDSQTLNRIGEGLEAHLSRLDPRGSIRSARARDVVMSVTAPSGLASSTRPLEAEDKVLLAWDGRLDNRSSITAACKLEPHDVREDAVLVAQAYSALGPELWPTLVGDYAVACWDSATRQLYLARDPFGTRPLYYYIDASTAIWSSELSYFVEVLGGTADLDEEYIAAYLLGVEAPGKTPYCKISSVRPGYVIAVGTDAVCHRQLWNAASCSDVRLRSDADYEARFRELFAQSVERRLRVPGTAIAELSGGLDSSSIVCMADYLTGRGQNVDGKIPTVSYVYDGSQGSDECSFVADVERFRNISTHLIEDRNIVPLFATPTACLPSFAHLFHDTFRRLRQIVQSLDASILLCGLGGDEITLSEMTLCPDLSVLFKRGAFFGAIRVAQVWAQAHKTTTAEVLWTSGISPLLPTRLQTALTPSTLFPKPWMGPALLGRVKKRPAETDSPRVLDLVRTHQCKQLSVAASVTSQCHYREQGCCDAAYPFLDRCLIEFLIGIPAGQKLRPTETRSLHRRAMKGILPENIRLRETKQGPAEPMLRALARDWPDLLNIFGNAEVHKQGYINGNSFLGDLIRAKHGICRFTGSLSRVLSLELWLRAHSRQRRRTTMGEPRASTLSVAAASFAN